MGEMLEYKRNFWSGEIQVSVIVHRRLRASTSFLSRQSLSVSYSRTRRSCWNPAAARRRTMMGELASAQDKYMLASAQDKIHDAYPLDLFLMFSDHLDMLCHCDLHAKLLLGTDCKQAGCTRIKQASAHVLVEGDVFHSGCKLVHFLKCKATATASNFIAQR